MQFYFIFLRIVKKKNKMKFAHSFFFEFLFIFIFSPSIPTQTPSTRLFFNIKKYFLSAQNSAELFTKKNQQKNLKDKNKKIFFFFIPSRWMYFKVKKKKWLKSVIKKKKSFQYLHSTNLYLNYRLQKKKTQSNSSF